jgi:uncharacterized membrane protein
MPFELEVSTVKELPRTNKQRNSESKSEEEILLRELEKFPKQKINKDDVKRVAEMVNEYQGKIKSYLYEQQEKNTSRLDRFADKVACFCGSWSFVTTLAILVVVWITWEPSRMSLFMLSFSLSVFTAFQAALIQMSQNRQAAKDKQEQMLDNAISYKAEKENLDIEAHLISIDKRLASLEKSKNQPVN